ncbi:MAG: hypothetical protein BGO98_31640 [Myxococcales bacterium 68-20]|nr:hypothetical protein [Myxococcales bacterium]OJY18309.1 MAG: hypothetical protein BGO98_31640 [Myxococcales bacterium 68-20]
MKLEPRATADFANAVARALGLTDGSGAPLSFEEPRTSKALDALLVRLGTALDARRPSKHAPSIGEIIGVLAWSREGGAGQQRAWPARPASRSGARLGTQRALAELTELVAQGSFDRTKRAERGRILAELILLFDLESLLKPPVEPTSDAEEALRRVRKALSART